MSNLHHLQKRQRSDRGLLATFGSTKHTHTHTHMHSCVSTTSACGQDIRDHIFLSAASAHPEMPTERANYRFFLRANRRSSSQKGCEAMIALLSSACYSGARTLLFEESVAMVLKLESRHNQNTCKPNDDMIELWSSLP